MRLCSELESIYSSHSRNKVKCMASSGMENLEVADKIFPGLEK